MIYLFFSPFQATAQIIVCVMIVLRIVPDSASHKAADKQSYLTKQENVAFSKMQD